MTVPPLLELIGTNQLLAQIWGKQMSITFKSTGLFGTLIEIS